MNPSIGFSSFPQLTVPEGRWKSSSQILKVRDEVEAVYVSIRKSPPLTQEQLGRVIKELQQISKIEISYIGAVKVWLGKSKLKDNQIALQELIQTVEVAARALWKDRIAVGLVQGNEGILEKATIQVKNGNSQSALALIQEHRPGDVESQNEMKKDLLYMLVLEEEPLRAIDFIKKGWSDEEAPGVLLELAEDCLERGASSHACMFFKEISYKRLAWGDITRYVNVLHGLYWYEKDHVVAMAKTSPDIYEFLQADFLDKGEIAEVIRFTHDVAEEGQRYEEYLKLVYRLKREDPTTVEIPSNQDYVALTKMFLDVSGKEDSNWLSLIEMNIADPTMRAQAYSTLAEEGYLELVIQYTHSLKNREVLIRDLQKAQPLVKPRSVGVLHTFMSMIWQADSQKTETALLIESLQKSEDCLKELDIFVENTAVSKVFKGFIGNRPLSKTDTAVDTFSCHINNKYKLSSEELADYQKFIDCLIKKQNCMTRLQLNIAFYGYPAPKFSSTIKVKKEIEGNQITLSFERPTDAIFIGKKAVKSITYSKSGTSCFLKLGTKAQDGTWSPDVQDFKVKV